MQLKFNKLFYLFLLLCFLNNCSNKENKVSPNIIYILADDLGYGEVGYNGQEIIQTPNIDLLSTNGIVFTQHYSGAPVCAPARYSLLTGKHMGHSYIRGNDEWRDRGEVWDYIKAFSDPSLEGQRPIPENTVTIGKLLQKAGYTTGMFGKWGLGAPETVGVPNLQGFDAFYGYNCQRQAHNLYPSHLWENETKVFLENDLISPTTKLNPEDNPMDESSYSIFTQKEYAPDKIHQKALSFIENNKDNSFFLFYASPLPHLPLQAPVESVNTYREILDDPNPYLGNQGYFPNRFPKATYAAMITHLDNQIGELIQKLKEIGQYENTIIVFSSDNGPTYLGGVDFNFFNSSKPFSNGYGKTKGFLHEGGIRVPMIVSWPNRIKPGSTSDHISSFYDVLPTLCDITGANIPNKIDGISFKNTLFNTKQKTHDFLYWEFPSYKGQQAVRIGKWKGIRKNIFDGNMKIELYNLENDLGEEIDLSKDHPDIIKRIEKIMIQEHETAELDRFKFKELNDI
ncbi:MAG: N-acetylgalactosamine-6-sulfatase [Flavobacteriaceae bacterium]|nr:N-acetylgalactosamine-6-sulfatase [Flavobacteriaceae bacterium]